MAASGVESVRSVRGVFATQGDLTLPDWTRSMSGARECTVAELPAGYVDGVTFWCPVIDMPRYLIHLVRQLDAFGVSISITRVASLSGIAFPNEIVINCSGLGAAQLAADTSLKPNLGQLIVVENPGITEFFSERGDGPDLTYILPQGAHVVLGGTAEEPRTLTQADYREREARILDRCSAVDPRLRSARIIGQRLGLRPGRGSVRVEKEVRDGTEIIHNYGHGGSGVSLAWGCAFQVLNLASADR
jgi:D-amino-acid oxidase